MPLLPRDLLRNIRRYKTPKVYPVSSIWPPHRRSAVMLILFIGNYGELRVLLTKRSRKLNNFSGHVSLPGGKADHVQETATEVARRECFEEIGLPYDEDLNNQGLALEYLNTLPCYLSKTFLSVRPVIYFLQNQQNPISSINHLELLLNPGETSSIFSVPLLDLIDKNRHTEYIRKSEGSYRWGNLKWPLAHYYYPAVNKNEVNWLEEIVDLSSDDEHTDSGETSKVKDLWGLTARIIYDLAHISVESDTAHYIGNENLIYALTEFGDQMRDRKRTDWESKMIVNTRGFNYEQVLPKHIFKNVTDEYKL